jgi:hypothetical protein
MKCSGTFRSVQERSWNVQKRSETVRNGQKRSETVRNGQKRSETVRNGQKRSETVRNGQKRSETVRNGHANVHVNGQERLGTFESEHNNALERIVENVHGAFTVRSRSRFKNERITAHFISRFQKNIIEIKFNI